MISLIVAASTNDVIGIDGRLPWRLPDDLRRFRALTMGKPIIMGRRTFESIGRPLDGRRNLVLTRRQDLSVGGIEVVHSYQDALARVRQCGETMVIGGGTVYRQFLADAVRIYMTRVAVQIDGDTHFPPIHDQEWSLLESEAHADDATHAHPFTFSVYERRAPVAPRR